MKHLKELGLAFTLVCCHACLATAGEFFRAPGNAVVNDGGKQVTLAISTTRLADGQIVPTITRTSGAETGSRTSDERLKPDAWFVFVESASRVWTFDGTESLSVL